MSKASTPQPTSSTVKVGITRLLNTAQFENIQISLETTDVIEWKTEEERHLKTAALVQRLNDQYIHTQAAVLEDIGCEEKRAWRKNTPAAPRVPASQKKFEGDPLDA